MSEVSNSSSSKKAEVVNDAPDVSESTSSSSTSTSGKSLSESSSKSSAKSVSNSSKKSEEKSSTKDEQSNPAEEEPKQVVKVQEPEEKPAQRKASFDKNAPRRSSRVQRRTTDIMMASPELSEEEERRNDELYHPKFPQVRAMFYRKLIAIKRSLGSVIANILVTLAVSSLAIVVKVLMDSLVKETVDDYSFRGYVKGAKTVEDTRYIVLVGNPEKESYQRYKKATNIVYHRDMGIDPIIKEFKTVDEANKWVYSCKSDPDAVTRYVSLGLVVPDEFNINGRNKLTLMWNDTTSIDMNTIRIENESYISLVNLLRIELAALTMPPDWEHDERYIQLKQGIKGAYMASHHSEAEANAFVAQVVANINGNLTEAGLDKPADMTVKFNLLRGQGKDIVFSMIAPLLISAGISSVISVFIVGPITDIQGPIRSYMVSCNLTIFPYWFVTFIMDLIIWMIDITLVWGLFCICGIKVFSDNMGMSYFILAMCGPSMLFYIYSISFLFTNPDSAARNAFIVNIIMLIIPIIISLVTIDMDNPIQSLEDYKWLYWIYCLFPPLCLEGYMQTVFIYYPYNTEGIKFYFKKESSSFAYSIFVFLDILIYGVILGLIEYYRKWVQNKLAHSNFGDYGEFFKEAKAKHPVTKEADDMAKEVENNHDYAVRIENVSRLFFNTEGNPIPAVNCVSLGVKKGSLFGFLGANGAGKTTLMNMITSMLPISDGKIEINGKDITVENDPSLLSVCPQFNTHLCMDMTIREHFHFYSMLHMMAPDHEKRNTERLTKLLELEAFQDIPIRELSEGDVRKLSIALSFLGKASIILLDEPTATLDPVSRHQVHEMILYYKGQKTFMLCTHLLSEAEALCDMISIMIKGNVYTCGSPQYLSAKFGTDFKVDMILNDEQEETGKKVDKFFEENLPSAKLSIKRPSARIYNLPTSSIQLGELFLKMEEGKNGDNGYSYYTCSSSSLEKVFMEIVRISEGGEEEGNFAV